MNHFPQATRWRAWILSVLLGALSCASPALAQQQPPDEVLKAEEARIAAIAKASAATISVFGPGGRGGGSGVVITPDGFALTNYHVVRPAGDHMKCSMPDGVLYDAVIVGIDPVGDVALIQLLGRDDFPTAELADSDQVQVGDWCFAVGNPFLLATDFQPTVSYGIVSGVHRYQYPAGTLLEYADCIQTDAAINPGNSGGPLFNADGELIGINGRGSFEKRGRVNVGVGYAISINQIKHFMGYLRSGRIVDHATLGANVASDGEGRVVVTNILPSSDAFRRGLQYGDEIIGLGGREITSVNEFKNVLGIFPRGWRVPLSFRREGQRFDTLVRLSGVHHPEELYNQVQPRTQPRPAAPDPDAPSPQDEPPAPGRRKTPQPDAPPRRPGVRPAPAASETPPEIARLIEKRRGFANYYFNRLNRNRTWNDFLQSAEPPAGDWVLQGQMEGGGAVELRLGAQRVEAKLPTVAAALDLRTDLADQLAPPGSGGMLTALHLWQRMLTLGPDKFGEVVYLGTGPQAGGNEHLDILVATHNVVECRFYFDPQSHRLVVLEMYSDPQRDPCELHFDAYDHPDYPWLPQRVEVRFGDRVYGVMTFEELSIENAAANPSVNTSTAVENQ